ncbi:MAG: hypothetical protein AAGI70_00905 [Pseudomonadota bacterium]
MTGRKITRVARLAEAGLVAAGLAALLWVFAPDLAVWPGRAAWEEAGLHAVASVRILTPSLALALLISLPVAALMARAEGFAAFMQVKAQMAAAIPVFCLGAGIALLAGPGLGWVALPLTPARLEDHLLPIAVLTGAIWPLILRRATGRGMAPGGAIVAFLVVVEVAFAWPGLGTLLVEAARSGAPATLCAALLPLALTAALVSALVPGRRA